MLKLNFAIVVGFGLLFTNSYAQQNLFNVPSGDLTEKNRGFFQHQINAYKQFQNNMTFSYGVNKTFEIGCNIYGLTFEKQKDQFKIITNEHDHEQPLSPQFLINVQKIISLGKRLKWANGTQTGLSNFTIPSDTHFTTFNYSEIIYTNIKANIKYINGVYLSNKVFMGSGNNIGYLGGIEIGISPKLKLSADAIVGNNASSVAVIGPCYFISTHVALSGGWQMPFNHHLNSNAVVFELTLL